MNTPNATTAELLVAYEVLREAAATIGLRDVDDSFWEHMTVQERALIGVAMGWPTIYKAHFEAPVRLHDAMIRPESFVAECLFHSMSGQEEPNG